MPRTSAARRQRSEPEGPTLSPSDRPLAGWRLARKSTPAARCRAREAVAAPLASTNWEKARSLAVVHHFFRRERFRLLLGLERLYEVVRRSNYQLQEHSPPT